MTPSSEDYHPEESHDEAEDRHEHHPAQRVRWAHVSGRHQDPHQTTKHLRGWRKQVDGWIYGFRDFRLQRF